MALTGNFKEIVIRFVLNDSLFAQALPEEVANLFLNGEPEMASMMMAGG